LTEFEAERLRAYVERGGFLYIDDDYGLDPYIRRELQKVFPGEELVELPFDHPIYHQHFSFPDGLPEDPRTRRAIRPRVSAISSMAASACTTRTRPTSATDGSRPRFIANPPELRRLAFQMGTNILMYALTN
jgi:hypothetical protein